MPRKKSAQNELRLVAYYRFSGGGRQNEQSIEGQRRDCEAYARSHGYTIQHEYIDRHISGKTDSRPAFQQMIADSDNGKFDALICWKTDRLARNRYDSAVYKNRLRQNGVKILYAAETVVDGPEGIILEGLMESLAEYYSAELSQKLRRGQRESALKCKALGGNRSFGYDISKDKKYVINPAQAPAVRYIFEQYAAGRSAAEIVEHLNANGIRTSRGNPFNKNSILRIITNEMYIGVYKYADIRIEGGVPAMIDHDLFDRCQMQLAHNRAHSGGIGERADYVLSGKLVCAECGAKLKGSCGTSHTGDKHFYYVCPGRSTSGCTKAPAEKTRLESQIARAIAQYVLAPDKMEQIVDQMLLLQEQDKPQPDPEREIIAAELSDCRKKQNNLLRAIEEGGSSRLVSRLQQLEDQEADLQRRLDSIPEPPQPPRFTRDELLFLLEQFKKDDDEQTPAYRRRLLNTFVSSVTLSDTTAEITFNIADRKTGSNEYVSIDLSANKNPPESDDITSNSEGSTALRLVDLKHYQPNPALKVYPYRIALSIPLKSA